MIHSSNSTHIYIHNHVSYNTYSSTISSILNFESVKSDFFITEIIGWFILKKNNINWYPQFFW